jgi:hypothetical protein
MTKKQLLIKNSNKKAIRAYSHIHLKLKMGLTNIEQRNISKSDLAINLSCYS